MLSGSEIRKLLDLGLTSEQLLTVMQMLEEKLAAITSKASKEAERTRRYRKRRGLSESEWQALRITVMERDGEQCRYCGDTEGPFHCDHIVPLAQGGTNDLENLTVACRFCNSSKSGKPVTQEGNNVSW